MQQKIRSIFQDHPFHLVSPSPWPVFTSLSLLSLTTSGVLFMHGFSNVNSLLMLAFISVVASMALWFRDVISEGTYLFIGSIFCIYNLNTAKAIPSEEIQKALIEYKKHTSYSKFYIKNNLGHYLAGLLEGDGSISLPVLGKSKLNRVLNPRIIFTSHRNNLDLYVFIQSELGNIGRFQITGTNTLRYIIPQYQYSIFIALLLSNGWAYAHHKINSMVCIKFRQPYANKEYIYYVYREISIYCKKYPYRYTNSRHLKGKPIDEILIATKWLYCLNEIYSIFYIKKNEKIVPYNIYNLLTPLVLTHWVVGSGIRLKGRGLKLCTNSFNIPDTVRLINVLIIKYRLNCRLLLENDKPIIYIYYNSIYTLEQFIKPHIIELPQI